MSFILRFAHLNGMLGDIFNALGSWITNVIHGFLSYVSAQIYTILFLPISLVVDGILWIFRKFAGLDTYVLNGQIQSGDIALGLINNSVVQNIFWSLLVLAIVLLFITTFVAIIKAEYTSIDDKNKMTNTRVLAKSFRSLLNFIIVPVVAVLGLVLGNAILKTLDQATSGSNSFSIGSRIFVAAAYSANRVRSSERFAADLASGFNNLGNFTNSGGSGAGNTLTLADKVDDAFINSRSMGEMKKLITPNVNFFDSEGTYAFVIFNLPSFALSHQYFSIYDVPLVMWYYDLTSFSYLIGIAAGAAIAFILLQMSVGLIKRLFYLATLLVISPPIVAMTPIDNGAALGKWRQKFIANALAGYSSIVALNLFIVLLGPLTSIDFFYINSTNEALIGIDAFIKAIGGYRLFNSLIQLLIMVAGFIFLKKLTKDLADIIGGDDAYGEGTDASKKIAQGIGKVAAIGAAVATGGAASAALSAMGGGGGGGPTGGPTAPGGAALPGAGGGTGSGGTSPSSGGGGGGGGGGGNLPTGTNISSNGGLGTNVAQPAGVGPTPSGNGGGTGGGNSGGGKGVDINNLRETISISRKDALKNLFSLASGGLTDEAIGAYEKGSTFAQAKKKADTEVMGKFYNTADQRKALIEREKAKQKAEVDKAKKAKADKNAQRTTEKLEKLQAQYDKEVELSKFGKDSDVAKDLYDHIQTIKDQQESQLKAEQNRQAKKEEKNKREQIEKEKKQKIAADRARELEDADRKRIGKTDSAQEKRNNKK